MSKVRWFEAVQRAEDNTFQQWTELDAPEGDAMEVARIGHDTFGSYPDVDHIQLPDWSGVMWYDHTGPVGAITWNGSDIEDHREFWQGYIDMG